MESCQTQQKFAKKDRSLFLGHALEVAFGADAATRGVILVLVANLR
jgi:hypothetical protein